MDTSELSEFIKGALKKLDKRSGFSAYQTELMGCVKVEKGDEEGFLKQFHALATDEHKVDFILEAVRKYGLFVDRFTPDAKRNTEAQRHGRKGDTAFVNNDIVRALQQYTRMIMKGQTSDVLANGYAKRSAALFKLGLYAECLVDIERALAAGYPEQQKRSLELRRQKASESQSTYPSTRQCLPTPYIPPSVRHRDFECCYRDVGVETAASGRRRLIARRNLSVGDILVVEPPFALDVSGRDLYHCHQCCTLCYNPIPCEQCCQVLYCTQQCRDTARERYHRRECPFMITFKNLVDKHKPFMLAVKMTFLPQPAAPLKEVTYMMENMALEPGGPDPLTIALVTALIFEVLKEHAPEVMSRREQRRVKQELMRNLRLCGLYTAGIDELVAEPSNLPRIPGGRGLFHRTENVASAIFPFCSLASHGCWVNAIVHHHGDTRIIRAARTIKRGEQILVTFGPLYWRDTKEERQHLLKSHFNINCECRACIEDWPALDHTVFQITDPSDLTLMREIQEGTTDAARRVLPRAIETVKKLESREPDKLLMMNHKILTFTFDLMGNRRRIP